MQIGHSSCGGSFPRGPTSFSVPRLSLPPRLSSSSLTRLHSFLCSLRCLFWHFFPQYQTHLHPLHIFRFLLSFSHAEHNFLVGVGVVPFFAVVSSFLSAADSPSEIAPSCSAAAVVPFPLADAMVVLLFSNLSCRGAIAGICPIYSLCLTTYRRNIGVSVPLSLFLPQSFRDSAFSPVIVTPAYDS